MLGSFSDTRGSFSDFLLSIYSEKERREKRDEIRKKYGK